MTGKKSKVTVVGGGTGTYTVLMGLKKSKKVELSVVVSMMDSGGSNRVLRDEFGLLPTSDIRQCMVALSSEKPSEIVRKLFTYRYTSGTGITGMTFGNLFMAALTDIYGSQEIAIEKTCEFLDVQGSILPVTFENTNLVAKYDNGKQVLGEHFIDEPEEALLNHKITKLSLFPPAKANPKVIAAIEDSDLIVLGPGDFYTSVLCNLVVDGVSDALRRSKAKKVLVMNLMSRAGQTSGFSARDHVAEMNKYIGGEFLDFVLINRGKFPGSILERYAKEETFPVEDDFNGEKFQVIRGNFVGAQIFEKVKSDKLTRSLIRHDPSRLAKALVKLL